MDPLAGIPESAWPLLQRAEEVFGCKICSEFLRGDRQTSPGNMGTVGFGRTSWRPVALAVLFRVARGAPTKPCWRTGI